MKQFSEQPSQQTGTPADTLDQGPDMWISGLGNAVVVHVAGALTATNRRDLQHLVLGALDRGEREVVVDVRAVGDIDTPALGTLVMLAKRVRAAGGAFHLAHVGAALGAVLALTKLDAIFDGGTVNRTDDRCAAA